MNSLNGYVASYQLVCEKISPEKIPPHACFLDTMQLLIVLSLATILYVSSSDVHHRPKVTYVDTSSSSSVLINEHSPTARHAFIASAGGKQGFNLVMKALSDRIHHKLGIYSLPNVESIQEAIAICLSRCREPYVTLKPEGDTIVDHNAVANLIFKALFDSRNEAFDDLFLDNSEIAKLIESDSEFFTEEGRQFMQNLLENRHNMSPRARDHLMSLVVPPDS